MKTHTSKRAAWLKSLVLLPLLAVLIYGFSSTEVVQVSSEEKTETFVIAEDIQIDINEDQSLFVNGSPATIETLPEVLKQFNSHLTETERKENIVVALHAADKIPMGFVTDVKEVLIQYGVKRFTIPNGIIMEDGTTGDDMTFTFNKGATAKQLDIYNKLAEQYNAIPISDRKIGLKDLKTLENIYRFMTVKQKRNAQPFPECESTNKLDRKSDRLTARSISIKILDDNYLVVDGERIQKEKLYSALGALHTDITKTQRDRVINIHVSSVTDIPYNDLVYIQKVATAYGYHRIVTPKEEIIRSKGNVPAALEVEKVPHQDYAAEYLAGATLNDKKAFVLQIELSEIRLNGIPTKLNKLADQLDAYTKDWEETDYTSAHPSILIASTPKAFLKKVDTEFKKTHFSKANSGTYTIASSLESTQKKATAAQIAEYNSLAKKYNTMSKDYAVIKGKELTRMRYIYDLMTTDQRNSAEPYPNIPPPPPAPEAPSAPKVIKSVQYDGPVPPPPPAPDAPKPPNPLDHAIAMAKKGADFYYNGKKITSDKGIDLLKKNKDLNIQIRDHKKPYEVRISNKPIQLQKQMAASDMPKIRVKTNNIDLETGNVQINGEAHFFSKKNGVTSYFNKNGKPVDKNGRLLAENDNNDPTFYYRGKKISSTKAHQLLDNNSSIRMSSETYENDAYKIVLTDVKESYSQNPNNVNHNSNSNHNPNSVIDLTEVISKGANFYLNNKEISTEKARYLAEQTNDIARVNVKENKGGKPIVYFWTK